MNYSDKVLVLIDRDGKEYFLNTLKDDVKHYSAYSRLDKKININLDNIINSIKKNGDSITGFDISKRLSIKGNVVFFHTDVSNYYKNKKEASIMIPDNINNVQKNKLKEMLNNLDDFNLYYGEVFAKNINSKVKYKRLKKEELYKKIGEVYE